MLDITLQKGNIEYLIEYLLPKTWQRNCYISEFEGKVQISYKDINDNIHFLKYTDENNNTTCWSNYGDNFLNISLAIIHLSKAPAPFNKNMNQKNPILIRLK